MWQYGECLISFAIVAVWGVSYKLHNCGSMESVLYASQSGTKFSRCSCIDFSPLGYFKMTVPWEVRFNKLLNPWKNPTAILSHIEASCTPSPLHPVTYKVLFPSFLPWFAHYCIMFEQSHLINGVYCLQFKVNITIAYLIRIM